MSLVRYRFFLYAGLLPYLLGAAWAWSMAARLRRRDVLDADSAVVVLAVIGVEAFNEYFDARMGTDRVFNPADLPPIPTACFWWAWRRSPARSLSASISRVRGGWPILAFALLGGIAAIFYEAPPIRWSYHGLGELVIGFLWAVDGARQPLPAHASGIVGRLAASFVPGLLIMSLAVVNAIPDYPPGPLVGKRNLVVRVGRGARRRLYLALAAAGLGIVPSARCRAVSRRLPRRAPGAPSPRRERPRARGTYETPRRSSRDAQHRDLLRRGGDAVHLGMLSAPARHEHPHRQLRRPLFVSWQLTRDCDLACLHCCTESAPGKRLRDELDAEEAMRVAEDIVRTGVPYVMLCGGEPLVVPHFFRIAESLGQAGIALKIETNGQQFDAEIAARLSLLPIRSVQVSLDGDTQEVYARQRPGGVARDRACRVPSGTRRRPSARDYVRPVAPQHPRSRAVIARARDSGAFRFNTGADAHRNRRAALEQARADAPQYRDFFALLEREARVLEPPLELCYVPSSIEDGLRSASTNRRPRCWCCRTAGSRSRRRFPTSVPTCDE